MGQKEIIPVPTIRGETDVICVPIRHAVALAIVAQQKGFAVRRIAYGGGAYRHNGDFSMEKWVPQGQQAICLEWNPDQFPAGIPREVYHEAFQLMRAVQAAHRRI